MKFMVYTHDAEDALAIRKANRGAHLDFLRSEDDVAKSGVKVISAGPWLKDDTAIGSLLVVEADSIERVKAWNTDDPYVLAGLTAEVTIHPLGGWTDF